MKQTSTPILIYGAGGIGEQVLLHLKNTDREPAGFIDRNAAEISRADSLPVFTPSQAAINFAPAPPQIIIAVNNFRAPMSEILEQLENEGFENTCTLWQFCQQEQWLPDEPYWLAPLFDWRSHQAEINKAYNLLADDMSKKIFTEQVALRISGDYSNLSSADFNGQYAPDDLPAHNQPIHLIDCGAFDGDTIKTLLEKGNDIEQVFAFEPDPASFKKLTAYLGDKQLGSAINAGSYDHSGEMRFSNLGTGASHLDQTGNMSIALKTIDECCEEFPATLIKMDVEGAEAASINGALQVIKKNRPTLALSIYHKPADLWSILLMINTLELDYQYFMRSHGCNGFDTVLYAIPRKH